MDDAEGGGNAHVEQSKTAFVFVGRQDHRRTYGLAAFVSTLRLSGAFLPFFFLLTRFALNRSN